MREIGKNILFVCTGNTCRSTMAEAIALKIISENKKKFGDLWVTSAGLYATLGTKAATNAIRVVEEEGTNLKDFRSKPLNSRLIEQADIILVMTNSHKQQLVSTFPKAQDKVFLLKEYIRDLKQGENRYLKAQDIYYRIKQKRESFIKKNKGILNKLEEKKKSLEQELDQVMTEIGEWEAKLYQETKREHDELEQLEKEIRELEINDPFGQPIEVYRQCYQELFKAINIALEKIVKEAGNG